MVRPAPEELRVFTSLRDVQLRTEMESASGLYLAEGEKVIRRAVEAGHQPHSFLLAPRWVNALGDVLAQTNVPCHVVSEQEIEAITGFHVHRGALAAFERPPGTAPESLLSHATRLVAVEDAVDHTNIGAIFRSAAALGFDGVLLSPRCADPYYRRSIKVAMGAVFTLPHARFEDWYSAPSLMRDAAFTTYALTLAAEWVPLDEIVPARKSILVVGSEGPGLTERWEEKADVKVTIPMSRGVDSLNVAACVAIACWHFRPPI